MKDTFYITTPIYYPNDVPHIGHAYTTVACDAIARYQRLVRGRDRVFFLTGTDEHGQNIQRVAQKQGLQPQTFVDQMAPKWQEVWQRLDVDLDDYIRTTEPRHEQAVVKLLETVRERSPEDIYLGTYEAPYCVACEEFKTPEQINAAGNCAIHDRPLEIVAEDNYFFRLSAYQDRLLQRYLDHPEAVEPEVRRNEVLSFIKGGLQDFSISRTSFDWGVPVPWDPKHVTYVWFDALSNYITAIGYGTDRAQFERWWPADVHMMAKDILRFHAIYWPAMLMAAGEEPPRKVFAHGYLLVGGEKMSKTKLTGIHPFRLIDHFGVDAYRYYFLSEVQFGQDGSFSWESMLARYNANLANGLGNLASRVLAMLESYFDGEVPEPGPQAHWAELRGTVDRHTSGYYEHMENLALTQAVAAATEIVVRANGYLVEKAPWATSRDPARREELAAVLYAATEVLRILAILLWPVMPGAMERLWEQLGIEGHLSAQRLPDAAGWGRLEPGTGIRRGEPLFPRLDE